MTLNKPPCDRDCKDRNIGCHGKCAKYIEWQQAHLESKKEIQKRVRNIVDIETYKLIQTRKTMKAKRNKKG